MLTRKNKRINNLFGGWRKKIKLVKDQAYKFLQGSVGKERGSRKGKGAPALGPQEGRSRPRGPGVSLAGVTFCLGCWPADLLKTMSEMTGRVPEVWGG